MIDARPSLEAAAGLSTSALSAYLKSTGWIIERTNIPESTLFSRRLHHVNSPIYIALPNAHGFDDALHRIADALRTLEIIEERPIKAIIDDVRRTAQKGNDPIGVPRGKRPKKDSSRELIMTDNLLDRFLAELGKELQNEPVLPVGDTAVGRLPVIFVIDHSGSTGESGDIIQINDFLRRFGDSVGHASNEGWERIRQHIDFCMEGYSDTASEIMGWIPGSELDENIMPTLTGAGMAAMGAGLELAANAMFRRLADYRARMLPCYRGYIFNITDGNPTDMSPSEGQNSIEQWTRVKQVLDIFETKSSTGSAYAQTFHMASRKANRKLLRLLAYDPSRVIDLEEANFERLFEFVEIDLEGGEF
jgi:uncharacterized protein YegL